MRRVRAARVRRLRIRKAVGLVAAAVWVAVGVMVYLVGVASMGGARTPAARLEASPVSGLVPKPAADVGVWVVDGSNDHGLALGALGSIDASVGLPARAARVVVQGKGHHVWTNAATVRQLLSAMGIEPDANDRIDPLPRTPLSFDGPVQFVDVSYDRVQTKRTISFDTRTIYSDELAPGNVQLAQPGREGKELVTLQRRFEDGRLVAKRPVKEQVLKAPVAQIKEVGRQEPQPVGGRSQVGEASWYDHPGLTAASPALPFGTVVQVTNVDTGATVNVVINDRGPFGGRIIDLSNEAFARIAPLSQGVCRVRLTW